MISNDQFKKIQTRHRDELKLGGVLLFTVIFYGALGLLALGLGYLVAVLFK